MQQQTASKKLAFEDCHSIQIRRDLCKSSLPIVNSIYDEYKKLAIGELDMSEIEQLFLQPEHFIRAKFESTIDVPTHGAYKFKKQSFIDTLELPNYSPVVQAVQVLRRNIKSYGYEFELNQNAQIGLIISCYHLNEAGSIELNQDALEQALEPFRTYATTEKELIVLNGFLKLVNAYKDFDELLTRMNVAGTTFNTHPPFFMKKNGIGELEQNNYVIQELLTAAR